MKASFVMGYWAKPNRFTYENFIEIPEGDHRVQISNVGVEEFNEGKKCFEIAFKVSGHHGKLWFYLWFDPNDKVKNAKKFKSFFNSFGIRDYNLTHYNDWIGKFGAVRVRHDQADCTCEREARVIFCIAGMRQMYLPPWG